MDTKKELKILFWIVLLYAIAFFLPLGSESLITAIRASLDLAQWYAREHVILCLLPAFFIAGSIAVFVSQGTVLKYFGANAKKWLSYSVAAISGGILAVCSCTILPLFTSIYKRGAGLGPAIAFLYSGPAISILSIILTMKILGIEMGMARLAGAILFSIVIGLAMSFIFRKEEKAKQEKQMNITPLPEKSPLWQTAFHFFTLVLILVFANWGAPSSSQMAYHGSAVLGLVLVAHQNLKIKCLARILRCHGNGHIRSPRRHVCRQQNICPPRANAFRHHGISYHPAFRQT